MTGRRLNAAWSISTGRRKMGLHQDRDEKDTSAAVIGVSLGDEALFRIGGPITGRQDPKRDLWPPAT